MRLSICITNQIIKRSNVSGGTNLPDTSERAAAVDFGPNDNHFAWPAVETLDDVHSMRESR